MTTWMRIAFCHKLEFLYILDCLWIHVIHFPYPSGYFTGTGILAWMANSTEMILEHMGKIGDPHNIAINNKAQNMGKLLGTYGIYDVAQTRYCKTIGKQKFMIWRNFARFEFKMSFRCISFIAMSTGHKIRNANNIKIKYLAYAQPNRTWRTCCCWQHGINTSVR